MFNDLDPGNVVNLLFSLTLDATIRGSSKKLDSLRTIDEYPLSSKDVSIPLTLLAVTVLTLELIVVPLGARV